jgi:hypothetical protein
MREEPLVHNLRDWHPFSQQRIEESQIFSTADEEINREWIRLRQAYGATGYE